MDHPSAGAASTAALRSRGMRALLVLPVAALAAAVAAPAPAATVSPAKVRFPQVAVNAQGRTVVAWERLVKGRFAVEARIGGAPLQLGRTTTLATRGFKPQVAVGADGTVAIQWMQSGPGRDIRIRVAVARPGRGLGAPQTIERRKGLVTPLGIAVQPNGRVVALWQRGSRLAVALARAGHGFGRATNLAVTAPVTGASIATDPRDGAVVIPYGTPVSAAPPANQQAAVRTLAPSAAAFAAPIVLSATGPGTGAFNEARPVALSGPGGAAVAYSLSGDSRSLSLARRAADGSWPTRERIAALPAVENLFFSGLGATLLADGSAVAAWSVAQESGGGLGNVLASQTVASIAGASGAFGAPQALTPAGTRFGLPAVSGAGNEAFVASAESRGRVLICTRAAGATAFGAPVRLTAAGDGDVLLAAGGSHVLAAYQQGDRLRLRVVR
jgi:hypothetical protein